MGEPYVTIGGKQVYPRPPADAERHANTEGAPTVWEEGWQRETTRVSVPVGMLVVLGILVIVVVRALHKHRRSRTTQRS